MVSLNEQEGSTIRPPENTHLFSNQRGEKKEKEKKKKKKNPLN